MDYLRVLYQGEIATTDGETLVYTVPSITETSARKVQTLVTAMHIVNTGAAGPDIQVWLLPDATDSTADSNLILSGPSLGLTSIDTRILTLGLTLPGSSDTGTSYGIVIEITGVAMSCAFTIFGIEITDD